MAIDELAVMEASSYTLSTARCCLLFIYVVCCISCVVVLCSEKFRVHQEIKRVWRKNASWYGIVVAGSISMRWLHHAVKNLEQEQMLDDGSGRLFVPLITDLQEDLRYRQRTMRFRNRMVNKEHVLTLTIQHIDRQHPLVGKSKSSFILRLRNILKQSQSNSIDIDDDDDYSDDDDGSDDWIEDDEDATDDENNNNNTTTWENISKSIPMGIEFTDTEFEVGLHYKIRPQTFFTDQTETVAIGHKVRVTMVFADGETAQAASKILKNHKFKDKYKWQVWSRRIKKKYKYAETSLRSMLAHWLTNMELDDVCNMFFQQKTDNLIFFYFDLILKQEHNTEHHISRYQLVR